MQRYVDPAPDAYSEHERSPLPTLTDLGRLVRARIAECEHDATPDCRPTAARESDSGAQA